MSLGQRLFICLPPFISPPLRKCLNPRRVEDREERTTRAAIHTPAGLQPLKAAAASSSECSMCVCVCVSLSLSSTAVVSAAACADPVLLTVMYTHWLTQLPDTHCFAQRYAFGCADTPMTQMYFLITRNSLHGTHHGMQNNRGGVRPHGRGRC